jgi:hypothetical protein
MVRVRIFACLPNVPPTLSAQTNKIKPVFNEELRCAREGMAAPITVRKKINTGKNNESFAENNPLSGGKIFEQAPDITSFSPKPFPLPQAKICDHIWRRGYF